MNLMKKMMLRMTVLILIPVLLIGVSSYTLASKALQKNAQEEAKNMTVLHSEMIEEKLKSIKSIVEVASTNESLISLINDRTFENRTTVSKYLNKIKTNNEGLIEMMILIDLNGDAIVSNEKTEMDVNVNSRDYFHQTLETKKSVFSDVLINMEKGTSSVVVTEPLFEDDVVKGMVIATIKFDAIKDIVNNIKIGEEGYGYLVDGKGLVISHPDPEKENTLNLGDLGNDELNLIVANMTEGKYGDGFYTYDGEYKYVAYAPVNGWTVASTANYSDYMASAIRIKKFSLGIAIGAMLISMISAYVFTKFGLVAPIKKLVDAMLKAGNGDLTARTNIKTKDEVSLLGDTFNKMMNMQSGIITEIRSASTILMDTAEELSASAQETNAVTEEITAKIDEISNDAFEQTEAIEIANRHFSELMNGVKQTQKLSNESSEESESALAIAEEGRTLVKQTVTSINDISSSTDVTVTALNQLDDTAKEVSGISATINGIADSINLLALNASIEAARAGEHGRGFSVVAEEVRKLAEQTQNESKDIQSLLNEILKQVRNAATSIHETKKSVDHGVEAVSQVDGIFTEIINSVESIVSRITTIKESAHKETQIANEMSEVVLSVAKMAVATSANTQEISAGAEEQSATTETLSATAEETSAMAETLNQIVLNFVVEEKNDNKVYDIKNNNTNIKSLSDKPVVELEKINIG